jgi:preprotein translocase subunit SecF
VVIFDRLRENLRNRPREDYEKVVNDSLLETMSRSINTGLTVLIMLFVLLLFGGESIFNFTLAMLVGIASGLYSSIFNASMVLVAWHRWEQKRIKNAPAATVSGNRSSISVRETSRSSTLKRAK